MYYIGSRYSSQEDFAENTSKNKKQKAKSKKHPLAMDEKLARGCFLAWIADEGGTMPK
ncbi:hypothetical protein [Paenibacillus sp. FSL E2-0178]|uniref:hypothetical protein n=1 Tax=Paenibacillus sp. FSL E2-0178 TaxID=2921361 RepID=UPI00315928F1